MTRRMTGLSGRSTPWINPFSREREDGGGGGKDEDDDDVGEDIETDDDDEDDDEDEDDEPKPFVKDDGTPFTKKDFDALQDALKKARRDARAAKRTKPAAKDSDDKVAAEGKKWQAVVIRSSAKLALKEAGLQGTPDKLLKLIDTDDIEVDEDGEVDGLTEQIDELKKDFPELFAKKRRGIDGADKDRQRGNEKLSPSEIQARQMRGEL